MFVRCVGKSCSNSDGNCVKKVSARVQNDSVDVQKPALAFRDQTKVSEVDVVARDK